jgi:hypothetical protein
MRVVIKPGGFILMALAIVGAAYLGFILWSGKQPIAATGSPIASEGKSSAKGAIVNGGFEEPFNSIAPSNKPDRKSDISGKIASGWSDSSGWAALTLRYADDSQNPHGGATCQRIEIGPVTRGQMQFVQSLSLTPGERYKVTVWVRASEESEVEVQLRQGSGDAKPFAQGRILAGKEWTPAEATGTVGDKDVFLMLLNSKPNVTLWVDDASIEPVTANTTP